MRFVVTLWLAFVSMANRCSYCCDCYLYHLLMLIFSHLEKIPYNCSIIALQLAVDIPERILSEKIQPNWWQPITTKKNKYRKLNNVIYDIFTETLHICCPISEILTRSIVLPRHHPLLSPSFPITKTWHPWRNGNWFGSLGLKSYNAVATTSRKGHDSDWFRLQLKSN